MELQNQIKINRKKLNLSQEDLAQKLYVTRQTVSNWETGKSYPDIHSLLLLSSLFNISLDNLIKGDVELMKKEICRKDSALHNHYGNIFALIFTGCILLFVPIIKYFKLVGLIIWGLCYSIGLIFALKLRKIQKEYNINTYREIVAFSEGKLLDEIDKQHESKKLPYQTLLKLLLGALFGAVITGIMLLIFGGF